MPDLLVCLDPVADVGVAGMALGPLAVTLIVPDHEKVWQCTGAVMDTFLENTVQWEDPLQCGGPMEQTICLS